ncbi:MAG TPA: M15 family metallopeptidase [Polyangium sp.]|nr:M15 family metallopeptidase [Polyangium sp.]
MNARPTQFRVLALAAALVATPVFAGCIAEAPPEELGGEANGAESPEPVDTADEAVAGSTVAQAAASSCSTSSVKGLSLQIIAEARCLNPDAYVPLTKTSNVTFGSATFAFLEKPAADRLTAALKENSGKSMTINSALRTVAQQYMLYNWYQTGRCSISLAAKPGASNHETGLALDVSEYSSWKTVLTNKGFKWLGSSDAVHFDYAGTGAVSYKGLDVKAFQRLWNRNNPNDTISVDGAWGPQSEARMKKSPAGGFAKGATCGSAIMYDGKDGEIEGAAEAFSREPNDPEFFVPLPIDAVEAQPELEHEACSDHAH